MGHAIEIETPDAALHGVHSLDPEAIILELPQPSAEWAVKVAAAWPDAFQVQITSPGDASLRAGALRAGADACFTRPLQVRELAGRLDAAVRRVAAVFDRFHQLSLENRRVKIDGETLDLSALEHLIIKSLSSQPGQILTAAEIGEQIGNEGVAASPASIRSAIARLASRTIRERGWRLVVGERGLGYRFDPRKPD